MFESLQTGAFQPLRSAMVETQLRRRGIRDGRVLEAMNRVPRHEFVAPEYRHAAYEDNPLPIGHGQTISQPYIVAAMLEALALRGHEKALEIGVGSGYVTALLAELAAEVCGIERHEQLAEHAGQVLARLGYTNVHLLAGDGSQGLPEAAPFDAIIVSAAAPSIPTPLLDQLSEGGRMILPVGTPDVQELQLVRKSDGQPVITALDGCRFVPLVGAGGFNSL